jgi:hypothetical protein
MAEPLADRRRDLFCPSVVQTERPEENLRVRLERRARCPSAQKWNVCA